MGRKIVFALSLCALLGLPAVAGASMTELYGYWMGTWSVDEKIDSNGNLFGSPPFPPVSFGLSLTPFNSATKSYGVVNFDGIVEGDVVGLALNGNNVSITIDYAPYSGGTFPNDAAYYAAITGTLSNGKITGNYDEAVPPPGGWVSWRGLCEMSQEGKLPEPATIGLIAMGGLWFARRRATQS